MIIVVTTDPADTIRVRRALDLLERQLHASGSRLPGSLRDAAVVHADAASSRQEPTTTPPSAEVPDDPLVPLLLTHGQTAARLNVSERTVQRLVADGALPAKRLGRRSLIAPEDLERFVAELPTEKRISSCR